MRWLLRLSPRAWRERSGDEVLELLESSERPVRDAADLAWSGLAERGRAVPAAGRAAVALTALAGVYGTAQLVVASREGGDDRYALPGWSVAAAVGLAVAVLAGAVVLLDSSRSAFGVLTLWSVALALFGLLAILSIGLLLLLLAAGLGAAAALVGRGADRPRGRTVAVAVAVGAPLPVLFVLATSGPLAGWLVGWHQRAAPLGLGHGHGQCVPRREFERHGVRGRLHVLVRVSRRAPGALGLRLR